MRVSNFQNFQLINRVSYLPYSKVGLVIFNMIEGNLRFWRSYPLYLNKGHLKITLTGGYFDFFNILLCIPIVALNDNFIWSNSSFLSITFVFVYI